MIKEIVGHPDYYITDYGEVFKKDEYGVHKATVNMSNGHARVSIDGSNYYVGKLVLENFRPCGRSDCKVFHIDNDYSNNELNNLVWLTPSEVQLYSTYTTEYRKQILRARV